MRQKLTLLALALLGGFASAEDCSDYPGMCVNQSTLMTPKTGASTTQFEDSSNGGSYGGCFANGTRNCGAFRINIENSHMGFDDPIVNRGGAAVPFASHLHSFFGATGIDYETDITARPETWPANSTSDGGTVNNTAYWVPTAIDVRTGAAVQSSGNLLYYKPNQAVPLDVQELPPDLRFIGGDATRTTETQSASAEVRVQCKESGASSVPDSLTMIGMKDCPVGAHFWQIIEMHQCLSVDGVLPAGEFSGTLSGWRAQATTKATQMWRSTTLNTNVTDGPSVSAAGGASAPAVVKYFDGATSGNPQARTERSEVTFSALTEGQSVTVAGRTWTAGVGGNTAEEVAIAFSGGEPNIDSEDHKSHLAAIGASGAGAGNCPTTHPYVLPHIRYTIQYLITDSELYANLRLSCDTYKGPALYCLHGDWRNGWVKNNHLSWLNMTRAGGDTTNLQGDRDHEGNVVEAPFIKYKRVEF